MKSYIKRSSNLLLLLVLCKSLSAQVVYEKEGGVLKKALPVAGFKPELIFNILNKLDILNSPMGYDVKEGASYTFNEKSKVYHGYHAIGIPRLYRYKGKIERQEEFFHLFVYTNNWKEMLNYINVEHSEVTDKFNLPAMYRDTFTVKYKEVNGIWIGDMVGHNRAKSKILNPKLKPLFVPVNKEQFIRVWIKKLELRITKEEARIKEQNGYIQQYQRDANMQDVMPTYRDNVRTSQMWKNYYLERKSYYENLLATMSASERSAPALAADPRHQPFEVVKGKKVEKLTGYMAGELADGIDAYSKWPLYHLNTNFFDARNPKAIQLMIISESDPSYGEPEFIRYIENGYFPKIDYKALFDLMLK